ncbi:MAG: mechanosensitive ion channel [Oscillatoria princeps RMCB-10]|nr:mechanosensitive ion channel [Oscillatoria princeps RMCB-10]
MKSNRNRRQARLSPFRRTVRIAIAAVGCLLVATASVPVSPAAAPNSLQPPAISQSQEPFAPSKAGDEPGEKLPPESNSGKAKAVKAPIPTAPVLLDGRQLFRVSDTGDYPAELRSELIGSELKKAARSSNPVEVKIEKRNQLLTIVLNGQYLLTVTRRDAGAGITPEQQAKVWAAQIQQAVLQAQRERSAEFIRLALILAIGAVVLALGLHWLLGRVWERYLRVGLARLIPEPSAAGEPASQTAQESPHREFSPTVEALLNLSLGLARTVVWLAAIFHVTNLFPLTRNWSYRLANSLISTFTSPIFTLNKNDYSVANLLVLICLLVSLFAGTSIATNLLKTRVLSVTGINRGIQEAVAVMVKYTLISLGTVVVLQVWGLDISSLTIVASALGVGIGFGFQDIAKNFASGIVLLFERRLVVGDFVEVGRYTGTIERIGARSTVIRTVDNISIIVPNSRFLETEVINWSHHNSVSRLQLPVGVAYGSDVQVVREALLEAAKEQEGILSFPPPQVFFKGFGESDLNFHLLVWIKEPSKQYLFKSDLYFRIEELFRQRQIQVPFPQRDLHLRSESLPLGLSPQLERVLLQLLERLGNERNGGGGRSHRQRDVRSEALEKDEGGGE